MSASDKINNVKEDLQGKAKEAIGKSSGDDQLKADGKLDQIKSDLKGAGEKIKDALKH